MSRFAGPIKDARAAGKVRARLIQLAKENPGKSGLFEDAARLLSPGRWQSTASRPDVAARLCALSWGAE
jgi:hypothetical protein